MLDRYHDLIFKAVREFWESHKSHPITFDQVNVFPLEDSIALELMSHSIALRVGVLAKSRDRQISMNLPVRGFHGN
jgi:hypothetical protein